MHDAEIMSGHSTSVQQENATQSKIPNSVLSRQDQQTELPLLTLLMPELHTEAFNINCAHKCSDHKLNLFSGLGHGHGTISPSFT
jgi:hypothetical protein